MESSNFPAAIESFEKAIEINPQFATGYSNLAMCYTKSKDYIKAEISHLKALEIMPNNPIIRINYGVYLIKNKKYAFNKTKTRQCKTYIKLVKTQRIFTLRYKP